MVKDIEANAAEAEMLRQMILSVQRANQDAGLAFSMFTRSHSCEGSELVEVLPDNTVVVRLRTDDLAPLEHG